MNSFSSHSKYHINIDGRVIPIVKPKRANDDIMVLINPDTFDKAFQQDDGFYIGKNGVGGIHGRYERFNMFVRGGEDEYNKYSPAESIEAAEISVREDGSVGFTNGRHRYAWMRDNDIDSIPVVMDRESKRNAQKYNYIR